MSVVVIHWTDRTRLPLRIDTDQFEPEIGLGGVDVRTADSRRVVSWPHSQVERIVWDEALEAELMRGAS